MNIHPSLETYQVPDQLPDPVINDPSLPLVTVVTPSYNQGCYIRETIESVLSQDYPNIEYWVIDGGSTDETIAILKQYEHDPRFHWISEQDKGQGDAVNKGWRRAQCEILGWLNSDDTYVPGALNAQVTALIDHPEVGVVYGDAIFVDEQGRALSRYHARPFDRTRFLHLSAIPQPSALIRRSLVMRHGGLNTDLHYALDYEFFLRLMWETPFLYTGIMLATYRLHDTSKTVAASDRMFNEAIAVVRKTCMSHQHELPGMLRKATSDWYWGGAISSIEAGAYRKAVTYSLAAILTHPLRPRMGTFGLCLIDAFFKTHTAAWLMSKLDQRAYEQQCRYQETGIIDHRIKT